MATVRALKYHGGADLKNIHEENLEALKEGFKNLRVHLENLRKFNLPVVVALNRFITDTEKEIAYVVKECEKLGVRVAVSEVLKRAAKVVSNSQKP